MRSNARITSVRFYRSSCNPAFDRSGVRQALVQTRVTGRGTPTILVIGTFDTKSVELAAIAGAIEAEAQVITLDSSVGGGPSPGEPDVSAKTVAAAAGLDLKEVAKLPRGDAVAAMQDGIASEVVRLVGEGSVHGALCVAGAGAHLVGPAFQRLPLGFPKMILTPLASGSRIFEPFVGIRDVAVLHSVADIAGVNAITDPIYNQAAGYIVGAARAASRAPLSASRNGKLTIAASMNGNTTPAVNRARQLLDEFEVVAFHANGSGGRAMEGLIQDGAFSAVLDFTTTELGGHLVGGLMDSGPTRMEVAGQLGLPQILVPGCLDFITCGRLEETKREFPNRTYYRHNPELTLVRLTESEMGELGRVFAEKANSTKGQTVICVPTRGFSVPDAEGGDFWDPAADGRFIAELGEHLAPHVELKLVEAHINDAHFVDVVVGALRSTIGRSATDLAKEGKVIDVVR